MALKKTKSALPPIPVAVLNYGNSKFDVNALTGEELGTILLHPRVQKSIEETLVAETDKMKRQMEEKLYDHYQMIGAMNFLRTVGYIFKIYDERKEKMKGKGFKQKNIPLPDLIEELVRLSAEEPGDLVADNSKLIKIADRLKDEFGQEVQFWRPEANASFYCNQLNPWEDDSIFANMTAWEIYELGVDNACAANLLINNASWIQAISEYKWATKTVVSGILERANEIVSDMVREKDSLKKSATFLRKFGVNIHDYFVDAAQKFVDYEFKFQGRYTWGERK